MVMTSIASNGPDPDDIQQKGGLEKTGQKDKSAGGGGSRPSGGVPVPRSKRGFKGFMAEVKREWKKINWPTKQETHRLTGIVLSVCLMLVVFLTVLSYVFGFVINLISKGGH